MRIFKPYKSSKMSDTIIVEEVYNQPLEKVWAAISNPRELGKWYFDIPDFELKPNHKFHFYEPGEEKKFLHVCEIVEIQPLNKLSYTWSYPEISKESTLVNWELETLGDQTRLVLRHEHLDHFKSLGEGFSFENFLEGWRSILQESLKGYLDNGIL